MNHSLASNKQLVERLYRDCINGGQLELIEELMHPDFVGSRGEKGPSGFAQTLSMVRAGFPDLRFTIEDLIAEGDRVVARWKMEGTNLGLFAGFPPSGKKVAQSAIVIYEVRDGKLARAWLQNDRLGLLQQIGAVAEIAAAAPKA